jgi:hypothetical protein
MGGRNSRPPPPPPPRPRIDIHIPNNFQQQIANLNRIINEKTNELNYIQQRYNEAILNSIRIETERDYWLNESNKLKKNIENLKIEIDEIQNVLNNGANIIRTKSKSLELSNQLSLVSASYIDPLNEKNISALNDSLKNKQIEFGNIRKQNKELSNKYNSIRNGLTRGDILTEYTNSKNSGFSNMNWYLLIIYFILLFILALYFVFVQSKISLKYKLFFIILFAVYPFFIISFEVYIYELFFYLYSIIIGETYDSPVKK